MSGLVLAIRIVLAVTFGLAGMAKLADRDGSQQALLGFGVPAWLAEQGAVALPVGELMIAACLLVSVTAGWGLIASAALLVVFMGAIAVSMARGAAPDCRCFGQIHSEPVGWRALARNGVLAAAAVVALAGGRSASTVSPVGWISRLSAAELIFGVIAAVLIALVAGQGWFLLEVLRQHGRILTRLETVEGGSEAVGVLPAPVQRAAAPASNGSSGSNGTGHKPGLAVGAVAPEFELPALDGTRVSLSALRARGPRVFLVFSDPQCGPCSALLPDIAGWQADHAEQLTVALVSRGSLVQNQAKAREHGLEVVLLQQDREVSAVYQAYGTPGAVLISTDGRIASPLAQGAVAIKAVVQNAVAEPLNVVRSGSNGAAAAGPVGPAFGSEVPDLTWPDLDGRPVSLPELRGAPLVLLFWNPGCGFCQRMLPELHAWEADRAPDSPHLLVISTGDPGRNRAMGLRSRVALEDGFSTGRLFGASGTPSAVLLDQAGRIATPVAVGAPGVLTLLGATARASTATAVNSEGPERHAART